MASKPLPSPEVLRQLLRYEPETGKLFWRERPRELFPAKRFWLAWNTRYAGRPALDTHHGNGYLSGRIFDQTLFAHRVIWALHYGEWPNPELDHINRDPTDNRIENLRLADRSQNGHNKTAYVTNTSGRKGVHWHAGAQKWMAEVQAYGHREYLGLFDSKDDAHTAYCAAAERRHGEFARTS